MRTSFIQLTQMMSLRSKASMGQTMLEWDQARRLWAPKLTTRPFVAHTPFACPSLDALEASA